MLLETFLSKFLPTPEPFRRKDALGWVWEFLYIYLWDPSTILNREGGFLFRNLDAIESRNFIMSSCFSCWISGNGFKSPAGFSKKAFKSRDLTPPKAFKFQDLKPPKDFRFQDLKPLRCDQRLLKSDI